jgi:glycosyltransferase involved in cell wall biosynthesis
LNLLKFAVRSHDPADSFDTSFDRRTLVGLAILVTHSPVSRTTETIELSVVMPCLNEARTVCVCIAKAIRALESLGVVGEVIVADNGSTDGSQEIAAAAGARVVHVPRRGYGVALQGGIAAARGRYVLIGDADDSYDFSRIEEFVAHLRAGYDLVMGNRFRGGIRPGAMPWHHRYLGNPILTGLLNLFFRAKIGDAHCGMRAFRKDAIERLGLVTPGMEFASEMVVKAAMQGIRISEVPVVLYRDGRDRPPHLRSFRDGWRHLRFLLLYCPLWLFLIPAGLLLASGLGLMIWLTGGPRSIAGSGFDVHTMLLGSLFVLLGYQTLWLGLYSKTYGSQVTAFPPDPITDKVTGWLSVERALVLGGLVFLAGVGMNLWLVSEWWNVSLGELDPRHTLRHALWGLTGMVIGVQTVYGGLFLGLLRELSPPVTSQSGAKASCDTVLRAATSPDNSGSSPFLAAALNLTGPRPPAGLSSQGNSEASR